MATSFRIYLLRHGEIKQKQTLAGKTDFMLSGLGLQQLKNSTHSLAVQSVVSSPRLRCCLFAKEFAQQQKLTLQIEQDIAEMDFGDWDGLSYDELWQLPKPNIGDFWQTPYSVSPPNGESFSVFVKRISDWWHHFVNYELSADTLIVTHAGVIKVLLALICNKEQATASFESFVTQVSVAYGSCLQLTVHKEQNHEPFVQLQL